MPLSVENRVMTPPGGNWVWQDETGFEVKHPAWEVFLGRIYQRKLASGAFVGDGWQAEIEDYVCRNTPGLMCKDKALPERHLNWSDLVQFSTVLTRAVDQGVQFVDQAEAERRAEVCSRCPQNRALSGICPSCMQIFGHFVKLVSGRKTSFDDRLECCNICSCRLSAAVHIPLEAQRDDRFTSDAWPQECWKKPKS